MKKIVKRLFLSILCVILLLLIFGYVVFHKEIKTLKTITKVNDYPLYAMEYQGDYGLDEFLKVGAKNDEELVNYLKKNLMHGLPIDVEIPSLGCSTFSAMNKDKEHIFGRNFDLGYSPSMLVKTNPDHDYASISMVNLGFLGYNKEHLPENIFQSLLTLGAPFAPLDGMNEKGLTIGVLLIPTDETHQDNKKVDVTTTMAIRLVLDKAATVEEAIDLLSQYDMHSSANSCYHFHIADAKGDSAVIEYIDNKMVVVNADESYQAATNFLLAEGDFDFGIGQDRQQTMMKALENKNEKLSDEEALYLLHDVSQKDAPFLNLGKISTQWSALYNSKDLTITIVTGMDYQNAHVFELN